MSDPMEKENSIQQPSGLPKVLGFKRPGNFKAPSLAVTKVNKPAAGVHPRPSEAIDAKQVQLEVGSEATDEAYYFSVLYTKASNKKLRKNKNFADGVLQIKMPGFKATLYDDEGKQVGSTILRGYTHPSELGGGSEIKMGNWELEVDATLPSEKFRSGEAFLKPCAATAGPSSSSAAAAPVGGTTLTLPRPANSTATGVSVHSVPGAVGAFKRPLGSGTNSTALAAGTQQTKAPPPSIHDPNAPGAIILNTAQWEAENKPGCATTVSPVVLDPYLARQMRPHQIEGVRFLYECTMGLRDRSHQGAILADAMGLGKTLTTIALAWTLLKQGPTGRPSVSKVLVVTPSSLTRNWAQEVKKWLGDVRLRTMVIEPGPGGAQQAMEFRAGAVARVGIVSYETLRQHASLLAGGIGLLIADEGHRLKSAAGNKTISALLSLNCPKRVLLTGTPVQNNLSEFFAMCDFACPDVLGSLPVFNRVFGGPIARSRDRDATEEERVLGAARSEELFRRVQAFVLRRGAEVNAAHLPPLSLFVVFCRPTAAQLSALSGVLGSGSVRRLLSASGSDFGDQALSVLTKLRKICNHPALYMDPTADESNGGNEEGTAADADGASLVTNHPQKGTSMDISLSGKLTVLSILLENIVSGGERCVVVSQSTVVLDCIAGMCVTAGYTTARIDGSTDVSKRQDVVNAFNNFNVGQIFLLSTTAGGAGLNLTGASRLILVDSHWNPALDSQAMARVWRDGQRRPCVIYRLVTTGTLEEKVYQRQRAKGDIANVTVGGTDGDAGGGGGGAQKKKKKKGGGQFSKDELRQLFNLRTDTVCDTADVLNAAGEGATFTDVSKTCGDSPLMAAIEIGDLVTFVHLESSQSGPVQRNATNNADVEGELVEGVMVQAPPPVAAAGAGTVSGGFNASDVSQLDVDDEEDWA